MASRKGLRRHETARNKAHSGFESDLPARDARKVCDDDDDAEDWHLDKMSDYVIEYKED